MSYFYVTFIINDPGIYKDPKPEESSGWCGCTHRILEKLKRTPDYLMARAIKYAKPPFMHNQIAFVEGSTTMTVYSMTYKGLIRGSHNFNDKRFGFLKVKTTPEALRKLTKVLEKVYNTQKEVRCSISRWKMSFIPQMGRWIFCMKALPKPDMKTKQWTCSEFTCYVLQKAGIIPKNIHPSYVDTTELFLILRGLPCCDSKSLSPLTYPVGSTVVTRETSADFVYSQHMPKRRKIPSYDTNSALSSRVI